MAENFVDNPGLLKDVLEKEVQRKTGIHWELYGAPVESFSGEAMLLWVAGVAFGMEGLEREVIRVEAKSFIGTPTHLFGATVPDSSDATLLRALTVLAKLSYNQAAPA